MDAPRTVDNHAASSLGRFTGPQRLFSTTTPLTSVTAIQIPGYINLDLPGESIEVVIRFRDVIAVANMTTAAAESPVSLVQNFLLFGIHKKFGAQQPINMSGATQFAYLQMFQLVGSTAMYGATVAAAARQAFLDLPYARTLAQFGNTGTYEVELHYPIPSGLLGTDFGNKGMLPYLWYKDDWGDSMQFRITLADSSGFGVNAGGTTHTFTAFGSAAGLPTVEVNVNYSLLGDFRKVIQRGTILRNEQPITTLTAAVTNTRIRLLDKLITSNVLVKAGTILAGTTAGVSDFGALSDAQLANTNIKMAFKPIRNTASNYSMKQYLMRMFNTIHPQGYFLLSFVEGGHPFNAFRGDDSSYSGATFELLTDVLTAGATQQVNVVQEEILSDGLFPATAKAA
jgi:hypothetical protein